MEEEFTKSEIVESIKTERQLLEDQLKGLSDEQMIQPDFEGGWSIKDIMAHIVSWEKLMVEWLDSTAQGEIPQMLPPGLTWDDLDKWNEQMYVESRDLSLSEVHSNFQSSFMNASEIVERFPEDDLINPGRYEWRDGKPLSDIVAANTFGHYKEHREQIQQWRTKLGN